MELDYVSYEFNEFLYTKEGKMSADYGDYFYKTQHK